MKKPNIWKLLFENLKIVVYAIAILLTFPITIPYVTIKDYKKEKKKYLEYLESQGEQNDNTNTI